MIHFDPEPTEIQPHTLTPQTIELLDIVDRDVFSLAQLVEGGVEVKPL